MNREGFRGCEKSRCKPLRRTACWCLISRPVVTEWHGRAFLNFLDMKLQNLTLAAVATLIAGSACAQTYTVKLGGAYIQPNANSSNFSGQLPSGAPTLDGVTLAVQAKSTVVFSLERSVNDNLGVELILGAPPKHDVKLKVSNQVKAEASARALLGDTRGLLFSAYADKNIAEVKQVAPTLFFNYKYGSASDTFRPYFGLGLNYTKMDSELTATGRQLYTAAHATSVKLKLTSSIAPAIQVGGTYKIDRNWSLNAGLVSTFVSSTLTVTTTSSDGTFAHKAKFDFTPVVYAASVGYSF